MTEQEEPAENGEATVFTHTVGVQLKGADDQYLRDTENKIIKVSCTFPINGFPINIEECRNLWGDDFCFARLVRDVLNTPGNAHRKLLAENHKSGTAEVITEPLPNDAAILTREVSKYDPTSTKRGSGDPVKRALGIVEESGSVEDYNVFQRAHEDALRQTMRKMVVANPSMADSAEFLEHIRSAGGKDFVKEIKALAEEAQVEA